MPSPNALPSKLKNLRGTVRKCREPKVPVNLNEVTKVPPPPKWLSRIQKKIYKETTEHLKFMQILEVTGLPLIVAYSIEFGKYLEASEKMADSLTVKVETGKGSIESANPLQRIVDSSLANAMKISSLFGLDPISKSKIKINDDDKTVDGLEEFMI